MFSDARKNMVDGQIHTAGVVNPRILDAFSTVPRESFVPEKIRNIAYTDVSLDLGQGRFLLEPIAYSRMLEFVRPQESDVVLDVGSASGYSSAILSNLVSTVISLEKNKRQKDKAVRNMQLLGACNVVQVDGEIHEGAPKHAPYSLIIINGAVEEVPECFFDQLANGGRLITVVKDVDQKVGKATLFAKSMAGEVSSRILFDAALPNLPGFEKQKEFVF